MTATQLKAMRAGRDRQLAAQRDQDLQDVTSYRGWLREEADATRKASILSEELGWAHELAKEARMRAAALRAAMPRLVPDSSPAWELTR